VIYDNISRICKEKGISIAKLEKDSGLGNATIRGWKTSSPTVEKLQSVARVLGCTVDELLSGK
jgi:transcriptional regulator with XRE-family HTH domain